MQALSQVTSFILRHPLVTNAVIAAVGIFLLAVSAVLTLYPQGIDIFGAVVVSGGATKGGAVFIKEVGIALLIAVIVNMSIEGFNRRRHNAEKEELIAFINKAHNDQRDDLVKQINQKMFKTVYERNIPEEVFRQVEEQLLRSKFLRSDSEYDLTIERFGAKHVRLGVCHRYKVHNLAHTPEVHTLKLGIDVPNHLASHYSFLRLQAGATSLDQEAITIEKTQRSPTHSWWEVSVKQAMKPGEIIDCNVQYVRLSPVEGKEVVCTRMPTKDMTVRVYDASKTFAIRGMSMHTSDEIDLSSMDNDGCFVYRVDGALFPGQGFLVDWMPKAQAADGPGEQEKGRAMDLDIVPGEIEEMKAAEVVEKELQQQAASSGGASGDAPTSGPNSAV